MCPTIERGGSTTMAEREGFEPSVRVTPYNSLAGCHLRPLGHLSTLSLTLSSCPCTRRRECAPSLLYGGGRGTRTLKGVNPAVFKTAALPIRTSPPASSNPVQANNIGFPPPQRQPSPAPWRSTVRRKNKRTCVRSARAWVKPARGRRHPLGHCRCLSVNRHRCPLARRLPPASFGPPWSCR